MSRKILLSALIGVLVSIPVAFAATVYLFKDVPATAWYVPGVISVTEKGIMSTFDDGSFKPKLAITRGDLAGMLDATLLYLQNPEGTDAWKTYTNKTFYYSIAYPAAWKSKKIATQLVGFQPPNMLENNVQWAVIVSDDSGAPDVIDREIEKMGAEYGTKRTVMRETKIVNNLLATHVTVRTTTKPNWKHEQVFFQAYGKLYTLTNGAIPNDDFELFYQSFKLLPLPAQKE